MVHKHWTFEDDINAVLENRDKNKYPTESSYVSMAILHFSSDQGLLRLSQEQEKMMEQIQSLENYLKENLDGKIGADSINTAEKEVMRPANLSIEDFRNIVESSKDELSGSVKELKTFVESKFSEESERVGNLHSGQQDFFGFGPENPGWWRPENIWKRKHWMRLHFPENELPEDLREGLGRFRREDLVAKDKACQEFARKMKEESKNENRRTD